jgi:hypothetical protein
MTHTFAESVHVACHFATEHESRLTVKSDAATKDVTYSGSLTGPYCAHARTLAAEHAVSTIQDAASQSVGEITVVDPCYWTPQLPFLYTLDLEMRSARGNAQTMQRSIGLRRWQASGPNVRLERERFVLRGAMAPTADAAMLSRARDCEVAILVRAPDDDFCREASRVGVALVAEMRSAGPSLERELLRVSQHPAVLIVLVDEPPGSLRSPSLSLPLIANALRATDDRTLLSDPPWANVLAVELQADQRPPAWIAACGKPAIAIRRSAAYADIRRARNACDRLQADLAPQFNLAGYFVGPE